ncbi:MAG TPA: hypothetical protein VHV77_15200, partial [Pirellulales bacterium]|nr:hypothetical protein [Pirellulales bacterium]
LLSLRAKPVPQPEFVRSGPAEAAAPESNVAPCQQHPMSPWMTPLASAATFAGRPRRRSAVANGGPPALRPGRTDNAVSEAHRDGPLKLPGDQDRGTIGVPSGMMLGDA